MFSPLRSFQSHRERRGCCRRSDAGQLRMRDRRVRYRKLQQEQPSPDLLSGRKRFCGYFENSVFFQVRGLHLMPWRKGEQRKDQLGVGSGPGPGDPHNAA